MLDYRKREMPSSSILMMRSTLLHHSSTKSTRSTTQNTNTGMSRTGSSEKKNHKDFVKTFMSPILPKGLQSVLSEALLRTTKLQESKGGGGDDTKSI